MVQEQDLYTLRKTLKLSQEAMAEKLGVSRNTVSRWERGDFQPSAKNLDALNKLYAELEQSAAPKEEPAAPQTQEAPPEQKPIHRSWGFWAMCALAACAFVVIIALCVGFYRMEQKIDRLIPEENFTPVEEIEGEEVDMFQIESVTRQPLKP